MPRSLPIAPLVLLALFAAPLPAEPPAPAPIELASKTAPASPPSLLEALGVERPVPAQEHSPETSPEASRALISASAASPSSVPSAMAHSLILQARLSRPSLPGDIGTSQTLASAHSIPIHEEKPHPQSHHEARAQETIIDADALAGKIESAQHKPAAIPPAPAPLPAVVIPAISEPPAKFLVNKADAAGLMEALKLDPRRARMMIEFRSLYGRFKSPEDLSQVSGISDEMVLEWENAGLLNFD